MDGEDMMDWLQIAQSLGIPVMCLVALSWAVWKGLQWIGMYVLKPLAQKHLEFVDRVSSSVDKVPETFERIVGRLDIIADKIDETMQSITEVKSVVIKTPSVSISQQHKDAGSQP